MASNILLMGLRGSGKTTIGRLLAESMRRVFVDLDERVLATFAETSVHAVWHIHGENAWREAERRTLEAVLDDVDQVVALGGGTPMIDTLRQRLEQERQTDRVRLVYLRCATDELTLRLAGKAGDRPSLTGADVVEEIPVVLAAREPTYRRLADLEIDVTITTPSTAVEAIERMLSDA